MLCATKWKELSIEMHVKQQYRNGSKSSHKEMLAWIRFSAVVDNNFAETTTLFSTSIFRIPSDIAILFKKNGIKKKPMFYFDVYFICSCWGFFSTCYLVSMMMMRNAIYILNFLSCAMSTYTLTLINLYKEKERAEIFNNVYHGDSGCSLTLTHFILMKKKWRKMLYLYRNFRFQQVMQQKGTEYIAPTFCRIKIKQKRVCFHSGELCSHI